MKTNAAPYFYPATLDRVIDGDTITCNLDLVSTYRHGRRFASMESIVLNHALGTNEKRKRGYLQKHDS